LINVPTQAQCLRLLLRESKRVFRQSQVTLSVSKEPNQDQLTSPLLYLTNQTHLEVQV